MSTLQSDTTPFTMAMMMDPMVLTMPLRQAPMEWKTPVICSVHVSLGIVLVVMGYDGTYTGYDGAHFDGIYMVVFVLDMQVE